VKQRRLVSGTHRRAKVGRVPRSAAPINCGEALPYGELTKRVGTLSPKRILEAIEGMKLVIAPRSKRTAP